MSCSQGAAGAARVAAEKSSGQSVALVTCRCKAREEHAMV